MTKADTDICFHEQAPCALILGLARTGVPEHGLTKVVDRVDSRGSTNVQLMFIFFQTTQIFQTHWQGIACTIAPKFDGKPINLGSEGTTLWGKYSNVEWLACNLCTKSHSPRAAQRPFDGFLSEKGAQSKKSKGLYFIILQEFNLARRQCLEHISIMHEVLSTRAESCKPIGRSSLQRRSVVGFPLTIVLLGLQLGKLGTFKGEHLLS